MGRTQIGTPARTPDDAGHVLRDGVRVRWDAYGSGEPVVLLLPSWTIVHSGVWKAQVPYLARHARVVTFDARGSGLSDAPTEEAAYRDAETVADAVAILDHLGIGAVIAVGLSRGARYALQLAAAHPDRVRQVVAMAPAVPFLTAQPSWRERGRRRDDPALWHRDFRGFLEAFFTDALPEPHSSKPLEDAVTWGLDTTPELLALTHAEQGVADRAEAEALCRAVRCPVLVLQGTEDRMVPFARGARVAELTGGRLVALEGSGHLPSVRDPVRVNLLLRDAIGVAPPPRWARPRTQARRVLVVSSPIGLGHAWRDVRIADELRRRVPGIEIHWLAQDPVTRVLQARGEHVHPASAELASEAAHVDAEAGEHSLHAFEAIRRMDEILCANFMVFGDVVRDERYDLWIGDEAWELDRYLHENPELKTAPFAWLTDFVGWLPLPEGGEREAALCADENADMVERVARAPRVRDVALYLGEPGDIVDDTFGPGLPSIRAWTARHLQAVGYVPTGGPADRDALRAELGWEPGDTVCLVAVGGSGTGAALLRRAVDALPGLAARVPGARMVAVAGPRLDPACLPEAEGLQRLGYVHELHRLAAACDVALVAGGLATTMELVAAGRPFVSVPLDGHFEQQRHVRRRLDRHGARRWLRWEDATPEAIAGALAAALAGGAAYRPVRPGATARAADALAGLVVASARG